MPRHRIHHFLVMFCIIVSCFVISPAVAQEAEQRVTTLDTIYVTDHPIIEGNRSDAYGSVKTVITEEQLEDLNAQDIETALRMTPGINMSRFNPVGSFGGAEGGGIFIRGMGSSRPGAEIKTLVDGAPMFMSVWNHPLLDLMSIDSTHTIEVYKSPQPQNFGNAFGLVNIVPKRKTTEGYTTKAQVVYGSYDTVMAKAEHGGNTGGWDYYVGGGYRESDGHRDHAEGELDNAYGRIGRQLSDNWDVTLFSMWNDNYADDPGAEGADPSERQGRYETRAWLTTLTLAHQYDVAGGEIKCYRSAGEGDWLGQPTDTAGVTEDLFNDFLYYGVKAKEKLTLGGGAELLVGVDWDYTEGDYTQEYSDGSTDAWDGDNFDILSPYTALSWRLGSEDGLQWTPSAGVRYYEHSEFDSQWAPHAGLVATYGPAELHVGYARGVLYPGLEVQVMSEKVIPALGKSWEELDPEVVDHYEVGVAYAFSKQLAADLTFFYEDGKDRYVIVPPPPFPPRYDNVEEFTIQGVEITTSCQPVESLSLFAGITLLDTDPSDLPYAPETMVSCGANWRFLEHFKLSLDGSYVSSIHVDSQARRARTENSDTVDSYYLINGKLSYAFDWIPQKLKGEIFVAGENLTDEDYEYQPGYSMPGINGMIGIQLEL
jgi:outer membrane receptor protein involved in Fe transport